MEQEYIALGRPDLFATLQPFLTTKSKDRGYDELAERLKLSPAAVQVAVHRLRQRFRKSLMAVVSKTLASEAEDEMRHLFAVLTW